MTSKIIVLRILDMIFVSFTAMLLLWIAGYPMQGLSDLFGMSPGELRWFDIFVLVGSLMLIHAIATSDSAP